jgi:Family of unknown function (DUF5318)
MASSSTSARVGGSGWAHRTHASDDISFRYISATHVRAGQWDPALPPGADPAPRTTDRGPRGRVPLDAVSFRPGAVAGVQTSPAGGQVEYALARNAVVREYHRGRLSRLDVCDAHPELVRCARNLGDATGENCPICEDAVLVDVTFVFGARLPSGGRCVATKAELARYWRRKDPVVCYVVEVCAECSWNHLVRMYPAGAGIGAGPTRAAARGRPTG